MACSSMLTHIRVLPAYAGMIPPITARCSEKSCAPRVCGDDPESLPENPEDLRCSPRMRG